MVIQGITYPSDFEAKKVMTAVGKRLEQMGCAIAGDGSLTVRVGPNAVWVTCCGADKGALTQDDFVRVDLTGKQMPSAKPKQLPADLPVHLNLYADNPTLRCVIHAYPAGVAVLASRGQGVEAVSFSPSARKLGPVPCLPAAGTEAVAAAAAQLAARTSGVMLKDDGCLLWGESVAQTFHRVQALEYCVGVLERMGAACAPTVPCPPPCPAPAACAAPAFAPAPPAADIPGLTPLIRPGDSSFQLPGGAPPAPVPIPPAAPKAQAPAEPVKPASVTQVPRDTVMAEVVRRAAAQFK